MKNPFHNINDDSHKEKLDLEHFIKPTMNLKKGKRNLNATNLNSEEKTSEKKKTQLQNSSDNTNWLDKMDQTATLDENHNNELNASFKKKKIKLKKKPSPFKPSN